MHMLYPTPYPLTSRSQAPALQGRRPPPPQHYVYDSSAYDPEHQAQYGASRDPSAAPPPPGYPSPHHVDHHSGAPQYPHGQYSRQLRNFAAPSHGSGRTHVPPLYGPGSLRQKSAPSNGLSRHPSFNGDSAQPPSPSTSHHQAALSPHPSQQPSPRPASCGRGIGRSGASPGGAPAGQLPSPRTDGDPSRVHSPRSGTAMLGGIMPPLKSPRDRDRDDRDGATATYSHGGAGENGSGGTYAAAPAPRTPSPSNRRPKDAVDFTDRIQEPLPVSPRIIRGYASPNGAQQAPARGSPERADSLSGRIRSASRRLGSLGRGKHGGNPPAFLSMTSPLQLDSSANAVSVSQGVQLEGEVMLPPDSNSTTHRSQSIAQDDAASGATTPPLGQRRIWRPRSPEETALTTHIGINAIRCAHWWTPAFAQITVRCYDIRWLPGSSGRYVASVML
jgi:hypothetical protein